jgi:thiol-disulfide isomerase/thioredoxin
MKKLWALLAAPVLALSSIAVGIAPAASAEVPAASVSFTQGYYLAPVGADYDPAIRVTVLDDVGAPVVGAAVSFDLVAETAVGGGAGVTLGEDTVLTDAAGVAVVSATASDEAGRVALRATVDGVTAGAWLYSRPPGFQPGEQLASVEGEDHDGLRRDIRDTVANKTVTIIDVCAGWCGPCRYFAEMLRDASAVLAAEYRIDLQIITVLDSGVDPAVSSDRSDAVSWRTSLDLVNPVMHAEGRDDSDVAMAVEYFTLDTAGGAGAFPTSLLVGSDGVIVDRIIGAQASVDEIVQRVLDSGVKAKKPKQTKEDKSPRKVGDEVTVTLDGNTASARFTAGEPWQYADTPLGLIGYGRDDSDPQTARRDITFSPVGSVLPDVGELTLSLTRPERKQALVTTDVVVGLYAVPSLSDTERVAVVQTVVPAVSAKGTTTVSLDLALMRELLRDRLEAGDYIDGYGNLGELTPELIEGLVENLVGVYVQTAFQR